MAQFFKYIIRSISLISYVEIRARLVQLCFFKKNSLDCDGSSQVVFLTLVFCFFKSLSKTTCLGADFLLGVCVTTP
jgi:hypothetical protein